MHEREPTTPSISVVVPTHNRAELLRPLGDALVAQQDVQAYELIVVDDCSTDETQETLQEMVKSLPLPMRVLRTDAAHRGPAAARNIGWRAASASLIAFTDDDCLPQPGWLAALVRGFERADVVQGMTEVAPAQAAGIGPFTRFLVVTELSWKFETCNVAYRRDLLERLDGFDESFTLPFGEDIDLGSRASGLGARVGWSSDAVVYHRIESAGGRLGDWVNWIRYTQRCESAALVVRRNPGWREHLFGRVFYKPYHAYVLGVFAGLGLARRTAVAAMLGVPWLVYRVVVDPRPARRRWLAAILPMALIADTAEVVATIRGSIRFRRFLL